MREIDWRIRSIIDRRNLNMKFEAQMHGMEIRTPVVTDVPEESPEKDAAIKKAFELRMAQQNGRR